MLLVSFTLKFILKFVKALLGARAKRIYCYFIIVTYIMCPYVRMVTIKALLVFSSYSLDLFLFWDTKTYEVNILSLLKCSVYGLCLVLKSLPSAIYTNILLHLDIFYNIISSKIYFISNIISSKVIGFLVSISIGFFKQLVYLLSIILYLLNENFICLGKYYRVFIFLLLFILFLVVEFQKNFFFLKKRIILSKKKINYSFVYQSSFTKFYNMFKVRLF